MKGHASRFLNILAKWMEHRQALRADSNNRVDTHSLCGNYRPRLDMHQPVGKCLRSMRKQVKASMDYRNMRVPL